MTAAPSLDKAPLPPRPRGVMRLVVRLPILLYRLHLGWILGSRFLLLTHRGRVSGRRYQTVLEVVRHDRARGEYIVVAGFGPRTDWYLNLQAHPALQVQTGLRRFQPAQRFLTPEEGADILAWYAWHHPLAMRALFKLLRYPYDGTEASARALAQLLPMVAFRSRHDRSTALE